MFSSRNTRRTLLNDLVLARARNKRHGIFLYGVSSTRRETLRVVSGRNEEEKKTETVTGIRRVYLDRPRRLGYENTRHWTRYNKWPFSVNSSSPSPTSVCAYNNVIRELLENAACVNCCTYREKQRCWWNTTYKLHFYVLLRKLRS